MNKILNIIVAVAALAFCFACNNEWEDEQFAHYVSFKAPINGEGCTPVYVKYKEGGETIRYELPLVVSGSTVHSGDLKVKIELDLDTLEALNMKNIGAKRQDIWFQELPADRVSYPSEVVIPSGKSVVTMPLDLTLEGLDQTWRYILPLKVAENQSGYQANTRKNYNNALLNIVPFNNYSGTYSASTIFGYPKKPNIEGHSTNPADYSTNMQPLAVSDKTFYAIADDKAFFYAGIVDHTYKDRAKYRVDVTFGANGAISFNAVNPELNFSVQEGSASYSTPERPDDNKPYLLYKYVIIQVNYFFTDYTGALPVDYMFKGSMTMQRTINTQIPDEDQAIMW